MHPCAPYLLSLNAHRSSCVLLKNYSNKFNPSIFPVSRSCTKYDITGDRIILLRIIFTIDYSASRFESFMNIKKRYENRNKRRIWIWDYKMRNFFFQIKLHLKTYHHQNIWTRKGYDTPFITFNNSSLFTCPFTFTIPDR